MKKTTILPFMAKLILLLALTLQPAVVRADGPWEWRASLRVETLGDAMYMPSAVSFDTGSERYYVVDTGRSRLVSFGRDGKVITAFTANEQLKAPFDMVRLNNGQLWVVEKGRNSLTLIDIAAKKIKTNTLKDAGRLVFPDRIAVFEEKLYILDRASGQVLRLNKDLSIEKRFGCPECSAGIADFVIEGSSIVALEPRDKKILRFTQDGTIAEEIKLGDEIDFPVSVAVGPSGFMFVLDRHQNKVMAYDETGQFRYSFLDIGHTAGKIYFPRQLRFDPWGNLCIVDEGNGRVEIYGR